MVLTLFVFSTPISSSLSHSEFDDIQLKPQAYAFNANHQIVNQVRFNIIPDSAIITAKNTLHIAYGHTSHGSQIISGMNNLPDYKESLGGTEDLYDWNEGGTDGALDIDDYFTSGDLGNPDRSTWADRTENYLDDPSNSDVNVVMWSWCGQVSSATEEDINLYLSLMSDLEDAYSNVYFIYMTGHVDGTGLDGNLHLRNEQIRSYCNSNGKILFDFADIESYNPDGEYFGDKNCTDYCNYDANGDGNPLNDGANWAIEWQDDNPDDWYECSSAHSQPLNANMKAYAAWWLFASIAGWSDPTYTYPPKTTTPTTPTEQTPQFGNIITVILISSMILATITIKRNKAKTNKR